MKKYLIIFLAFFSLSSFAYGATSTIQGTNYIVYGIASADFGKMYYDSTSETSWEDSSNNYTTPPEPVSPTVIIQ